MEFPHILQSVQVSQLLQLSFPKVINLHGTREYRQTCSLQTYQGLNIAPFMPEPLRSVMMVLCGVLAVTGNTPLLRCGGWLGKLSWLDASSRKLSVPGVEQAIVRLSTKKCCLLTGLAQVTVLVLLYLFNWFLLFDNHSSHSFSGCFFSFFIHSFDSVSLDLEINLIHTSYLSFEFEDLPFQYSIH